MSIPMPSLETGEALAPSAIETYDAIVVGGSLGGLVVAYFLAQFGYRTQLVEKAPQLGGLDGSFENANGRVFDFGLHVLDSMRSELATRLFRHVVGGRTREVERRRGIVLRGHMVEYNAEPGLWPDELRALLPSDRIVDDLGEAPPTRANLARIYGREFTDLIFDEGLRSYPSDQRHLAFGVEEHRLVTGLYPWFFPRAARKSSRADASRIYQDSMRERARETMLYPLAGGFGGFVQGFREHLERAGVGLSTGAPDLEFDFDHERRRMRSIRAGGRRFRAPRVYWCAPADVLCGLLGLPHHDTRPDRFVLGSFELSQPVGTDFTELIVADPEHLVNRVSFPGKLSGGRDDQVQLEFAFPKGDELASAERSFWMESWWESLRRLRIVSPACEVVDFDWKSATTLYNSFGVDGRPMPEIELDGLPADSNLRPVLPTIRKVNINTRVPQYLDFLVKDLARSPA